MIHLLFNKSVVPLKSNSFSKFLPWIVGFMIYLSLLTISIGFVGQHAIKNWVSGLQNKTSIQILHSNNQADITKTKKLLPKIKKSIARLPVVQSVKILDKGTIYSLLTPWLGEGIKFANLPIPDVIEIETIKNAKISRVALKKILDKYSFQYVIDDSAQWREKILNIAQIIQNILFGISGLIFFFTMIIIIASTRALMLMNTKTLYMMLLMGATDSFVSKDFCTHAFNISIKSASLAYIANAFTLFSAWYFTGQNIFILRQGQWALLIISIFLTAFTGFFVARSTVQTALRHSSQKHTSSI